MNTAVCVLLNQNNLSILCFITVRLEREDLPNKVATIVSHKQLGDGRRQRKEEEEFSWHLGTAGRLLKG